MKTLSAKTAEVKRAEHTIDCTGESIGRVATRIAKLLIGKHKALYTTNIDVGDKVIVVNASKVRFSGNKLLQKKYYHHSGFPGGFREESAERLMVRDARKAIEHAVTGMLPKNKLRADRLERLTIYVKEAPHA